MASIVTARYVSFVMGIFHRARDTIKLFSSRALQVVGATVCNRKRLQWATSPSSNILNIPGTRDINDVSSLFFFWYAPWTALKCALSTWKNVRKKKLGNDHSSVFSRKTSSFFPLRKKIGKKETRKLLFHLLVFNMKYLLMHFVRWDILLCVIF